MRTKTSRRAVKTGARKYHPVADLPFVKDTPNGRNFWSVKRPDDPWQESRLGRQYALAALCYETSPDKPDRHPLLPVIVGDMPRKLGHLEISFLSVIGFAAMSGRPEAERLDAYWRRCAAEREATAAVQS